MTQGLKSLFLNLFLSKKKNRSGPISIVIVDKSQGKSNEHKTIGAGSKEEAIEELCKEGMEWISEYTGKGVWIEG